MNRWINLCLVGVFALTAFATTQAADDDGWVTIFDGKTFDGWKINETPESWKIEDGCIVANGTRSHIFYVGDEEPFVNFEFKADVMTRPGSNSGIYFHTRYQDEGWPKYGFESQVNISQGDYIKTGSLYQVVNVHYQPAKDNEFWTQHIIVQGKHVIVKINDKVVVDYTEPNGAQPGNDFTRVLDKGTFAFQAHDPGSTAYFKNIKVKRLP
jgi:hypothetical protein